jgi:hypothetical protein
MATIAKIGRVVCARCGTESERFIKAEQGWTCQCDCGGTMSQHRTERRAPASVIEYGNGQGVPLVTEGCHPSEVQTYQRACPSINIRPDGTFWTHNRGETKRALGELRAFRASRS